MRIAATFTELLQKKSNKYIFNFFDYIYDYYMAVTLFIAIDLIEAVEPEDGDCVFVDHVLNGKLAAMTHSYALANCILFRIRRSRGCNCGVF